MVSDLRSSLDRGCIGAAYGSAKSLYSAFGQPYQSFSGLMLTERLGIVIPVIMAVWSERLEWRRDVSV